VGIKDDGDGPGGIGAWIRLGVRLGAEAGFGFGALFKPGIRFYTGFSAWFDAGAGIGALVVYGCVAGRGNEEYEK
jgi:hypothetical protein